MEFAFCVYGEPTPEVAAWAAHWGFREQKSGPFTNLLVPVGYDITQCFETPEPYEYLDGFSPNLNKHLHLGHFCNLVLANALMKLGVAKQTVAILGDTLEGEVSKEDALAAFKMWCGTFSYDVDKTLLASEVKLSQEQEDEMLVPGEGKYEGTLCFDTGEQKVVGKKADGSTTYFYQDIALAYELNKPYAVITGTEQKEHFEMVQKLCPWMDHIGMGLVKNDGKKMSSREGNVIMMADIVSELNNQFENMGLTYNAVAGQLLNYSPASEKNIVKSKLTDPKHSPGVYLSYAMARLHSAGCKSEAQDRFQSIPLQYAWVKAQEKRDPSILLKALMDHAKSIHSLYEQHPIKGNFENRLMFEGLLNDLKFGMSQLGLFPVYKVPERKEDERKAEESA